MRLASFWTDRWGLIALDWWWPENGLVVWVGGRIRWRMWRREG